jgi:nicotinamide mononucleotide transporter
MATTTSLSLAAQYMMSRKILENWSIWNVANVIYIGLYIYKSLYLTAFLYLVFLVMCIAGHIRWRKELDEKPLVAAAAV